MPKVRSTQLSIVVSANAHNPTILNPDFLRAQGIVPADWAVGDSVVTSPPFSAVQYESGVAITVDLNRLQIIDAREGVTPGKSPIAEIAGRYVDVLPHIPYTGVGTNFQAIAESHDPTSFLKDKFLREGPWDSPQQPLSAVGLRLVYPLADGRLTMSFDVAEVPLSPPGEGATQSVIGADANFHRDVSNPKEAHAALGNFESDWARFQDALKATLHDDGS